MKYIILFFIFFAFGLNAQKTYPHLYKDSIGDEYIVLTLQQAQNLDNATEFSPVLFKDNSAYYKLVDSICYQKISSAINEIVSIKDNEISGIKKSYEETQYIMENLKLTIDDQKTKISILENQDIQNKKTIEKNLNNIEDLNNIIRDKNTEIVKQRKNSNKAILFGVISFVFAFIVSI
jgi:septal ring factor EnvC (AmiA/AmiB activator)